MRYLRLFTNAVTGGVLGAAYLAVLVLQLNPQVPAGSVTAVRWFATLLMFYGLYLSVGLYLLLLVRELLAARPLSPGWLSVRLLAWIGALEAGTSALITWGNLQGFGAMLSAAAAERLREGALATTILAAVLLVLAVLRYSFGHRATRRAAVLLVASMGLSVAMPLWLRGSGELPVPSPGGPSRPAPPVARRSSGPALPHVHVVAIDGASMRFIRQRVAAGQLPNFANLLDGGAAIDLATLKPTQAETVWAAAATGKYPPKNGIRSRIRRVQPDDVNPVDLLPDYCFAQALVAQNFVSEEDFTPAFLRARSVWEILADYGIPSGVVNWPLTYPATAENGYVISDRFDEGESYPLRLARAGAPTTASAIAREAFDFWRALPWQEIMPPVSAEEAEPVGLQRVRWDHAYRAAATDLDWEFRTRLTTIRYEAVDVFGHSGLREAEPELFGQIGRIDPAPVAPRSGVWLSGRRDWTDRRRPLARRSAHRRLRLRHGSGDAAEAARRARARRARAPRLARFGAGRLPHCVRRERAAQSVAAARSDRGSRAHGALLPRRAGRPRHGRVPTDRSLPAQLHDRAPGHLHRDA